MADEHEHDHDDHEHHHHEHRPMEYAEAVEQFRADKDAYFKTRPGSPIPAAERETFAGLPYFPVDESLRFEGLDARAVRRRRARRASRSRRRTASSDRRIGRGRSAFELGGEPRR